MIRVLEVQEGGTLVLPEAHLREVRELIVEPGAVVIAYPPGADGEEIEAIIRETRGEESS